MIEDAVCLKCGEIPNIAVPPPKKHIAGSRMLRSACRYSKATFSVWVLQGYSGGGTILSGGLEHDQQ